MSRMRHSALFLLALTLASTIANAADLPDHPDGYACATAHPLATQACLDILAAGGNAFDAAVAASAAIAVVEPTGSGLGGGGFWLLHRTSDGFSTFIDGRETAPSAARADMYLKPDGTVDNKAARDGALAAAIPGAPAALDHLASRYGSRPLAQLLAPAIGYARDGFAVDAKLAKAIAFSLPRVSAAARDVIAPQGRALAQGDTLRQADLAATLESLATRGAAGFYQGALAQKLVDGVRAAGGIWTLEDLRRYRVKERKPLITWFRQWRIVTAPLPSAGGVGLAQIFQQLETLGWQDDGSVLSKHRLIEAMRRAYRDRAAWLGDPDFNSAPVYRLAARGHAMELARSIVPDRATPSSELAPALPTPEGSNTSHISVIDAQGNRVAATLSINLVFGSGYMVPGTGVFLNNEMDDFSASPTASNAYDLAGSIPNAIAPNKRPLSSMTPSFVEGPRGVLVIGTPGGSRIITMVALGMLGWMHGLPLAQVVALPRFHHQFMPDQVYFEPGAFDAPMQAQLSALGHTLVAPEARSVNLLPGTFGNMHAVSWELPAHRVDAASDPRAVGVGRAVGAAPASGD